MAKKRKQGYSPPKVREDVVNRLVELYKKNHPEEFQTVTNAAPKERSLPKGYPVIPPANLPPS